MHFTLPVLWKLGKRQMSNRLPCSFVSILLSYPFELNFILFPLIEALSASLVGNLIFRAFLNCMTRVIRQANDKELNGIPNIFDLGRLPFHSEVLSPKAMLDVHSMQ